MWNQRTRSEITEQNVKIEQEVKLHYKKEKIQPIIR